MKHFTKIIFFLTLSLGVNGLVAQADEEPASQETIIVSNALTFSDDIENRSNTFNIEEQEAVFTSSNNVLSFSQYDISLMAQIVYSESKGEPYEGKVAVASVILNRVLDPKFPNTVNDVVFQPNAFSCVINGQINVTPTEECYAAVYDAISGVDPTNEAVFFYNPTIATCGWMKNAPKSDTTQIGQHVFFKIVY